MSDLLSIQAALDGAVEDVSAGRRFNDLIQREGIDPEALDDVVTAFAAQNLGGDRDQAAYATGIEFGIAMGMRAIRIARSS